MKSTVKSIRKSIGKEIAKATAKAIGTLTSVCLVLCALLCGCDATGKDKITDSVTEECRDVHESGEAKDISMKDTNRKDRGKVACVGDSITFGAFASDRATKSYPALLQAKLGENFVVKNFGYGGASYVETPVNYKPYAKCDLYVQSLDFNPDFVVMILGTNDVNSWDETKPVFEDAVSALVGAYSSLPSKPVIYLCSPLRRYDNAEKDRVILREIMPVLEKVAERENCVYVNLHSKTGAVPWCFHDGLHPNDKGYALLADLIHEIVFS